MECISNKRSMEESFTDMYLCSPYPLTGEMQLGDDNPLQEFHSQDLLLHIILLNIRSAHKSQQSVRYKSAPELHTVRP